ncbi:MAG TPA: response regulator, partial [Armatimonadota bacterium]
MADPLRVILIEDNVDDALLIEATLEEGDFAPNIHRLESEAALRAALAEGPWDIVISDYRLPHFNGLAALRIVREADADLPFILLSGVVGEEITVEAMRAGAGDFILKDHLVRLAPAVRRELKEAENRRERRQAEEDRQRLLAEVQRRATELDATLSSIADGVTIYDNDGNVVHLNATAQRLTGYTMGDPHHPLSLHLIFRHMEHPDGTPYAIEDTPSWRA